MNEGRANILSMLFSLIIVFLNFTLIEIFACEYYFLYFLMLLFYIYFLNSKVNVYRDFSVVILVYSAMNIFDDTMFELFLKLEIYKYYIFVEDEVIFLLSFVHIFLLKYLSYYFDLKKLGYNLIKK